MSKVLLLYKKLVINILPTNYNTWQACEGQICKQHQIKQSLFAQFKSQYVESNLKVIILKHPVVISNIPVGAVHVLKVPTHKCRRIIRSADRSAPCSSISSAPLAVTVVLSIMTVNWLLQNDHTAELCNQPIAMAYRGMIYLLITCSKILTEKLTGS
jgi:hypothetical protein